MGRKTFVRRFSTTFLAAAFCSLAGNQPALAFTPNPFSTLVKEVAGVKDDNSLSTASTVQATVAYKPLAVFLPEFGVHVPVACWFPIASTSNQQQTQDGSALPPPPLTVQSPTYRHRISVRKIGQLLAKWNNIPGFVSRNYALRPSSDFVTDGTNLSLPNDNMERPVVILAHGFLGSRYDLSHLAEELAARGFVCFAAEYPESLAASYDPQDGLDRLRINQVLLQSIERDWKIRASSYGIVGHSLGCGTALQTGDDKWTRVLISGFPRQRDGSSVPGNLLLLTSMNDGLVSRYLGNTADKQAMVPSDFALLEEAALATTFADNLLPRRSMLIFDRPDAPNHISFLSENVNDAMIEFLSPLLPVARAFKIPVLDFDRYQISRDSKVTAQVVHPIVVRYLQQEMIGKDR